MRIQRFFTRTLHAKKWALNIYFFLAIILMYQTCYSFAYRERKYSNYGERVHEGHQGHQGQRDSYGVIGNYKHHTPSEVVIESVEIPYPVRVGQTIQLKCKWRLGSKTFYALRWYKNGEQLFYSYINGEKQRRKVDGFHVVEKDSDDHTVTLSDITHEAEDVYTCEIMSDGPPFMTNRSSANLTVVELPETPQFIGLHHSYMVGDNLNVTCRAANGRPAPTLTLKVNDKPEKSTRLIEYRPINGDRPYVSTSETRLLLTLSDTHTPSFKLGCYANTHGINVQKEVNVQVNQRRNSLFTYFSGKGNIVHPPGSSVTTCVVVMILISVTVF